MNIEIKKMSPELLDAWLDYFDNVAYAKGDGSFEQWQECYCMHFHWKGPEPSQPLEKCKYHSRAMAIDYFRSGWMQGYLAFDGGKVVGWCNANDKERYTSDVRRYPAQDKNNKIKSIVCFNICPPMRNKGIGTMFLEKICADAAAEGYDYVEAYPSEWKDPKNYHGPPRLYEKAGFVLHKQYKDKSVVRKYLKIVKPEIIKMDNRYIVGLFGSRSKQGELWSDFDERYAKNPFAKADEYKCSIYFWGKNPKPNKNIFFGFESGSAAEDGMFDTIELPACEWAVFEVKPARWWAAGDKDVEGWIAKHEKYRWRTYNGAVYQLEYYKEKFKGADDPDSLMEVWYPLEEI